MKRRIVMVKMAEMVRMVKKAEKAEKIKVALGLSGGVDSAVSAYLLKKQGFDVSGVYLHCFDDDAPGCRGKQDRKDALAVAIQLGLPFQVLDFRKEYQAAVIDYFKKEYLLGRTPNPDVVCNRDIKFGLFLDWAVKHHFEYVATGHYAKMATMAEMAKNGYNHSPAEQGPALQDNHSNHFDHFLLRPLDEHKDQTYFLWAVPRQKFRRVLFPLGNLLKSEVREIAKDAGLGVADKKDSTGICFVGEVRVEDFLKRLGVKEKIGEVVTRKKMTTMAEMAKNGYNHSSPSNHSNHFNPFDHYQIIGSHRGVWFYTIGQRHGFEIFNFQFSNSKQGDRPPLYVIEKDIKKNRLIVGFGAETYRSQFRCQQLNWQIPNPKSQIPRLKSIFARIRHGGNLIPCRLEFGACDLKISLSEAQRGIAPGQSAVFYTKDGVVLGGGVIQ